VNEQGQSSAVAAERLTVIADRTPGPGRRQRALLEFCQT
jgi:hypothetical protein